MDDAAFMREYRKFMRSDVSFEHEVVQTIISKYGLTAYKVDLMDKETRMYNLDKFSSRFPEFPLYLFSSYIPGLTKSEMVAKMFNNFEKCPFVTTFKDALEEQVPDEFRNYPCGLIFNYPRVPKGMILHSKAIEVTKPGTRLVFSQDNGTVLTLQTFTSLLEDVGDAWIT